jgi:hypothetical protein
VGVPILLVLFALAVGTVVAVVAFFTTPDKEGSDFARLCNAGKSFVTSVTLVMVVLGFLWAAHVFDPRPTGHLTPAPPNTPDQLTTPAQRAGE